MFKTSLNRDLNHLPKSSIANITSFLVNRSVAWNNSGDGSDRRRRGLEDFHWIHHDRDTKKILLGFYVDVDSVLLEAQKMGGRVDVE